MKDLKSKLIALMLVIPLLLIFTTSSVVKITSILVDVPVANIEIVGDSSLSVDIAAEDNTVQINTVVYPENATNKTVTYEAEAVEGAEEARVLISDTGLVTPLSSGTVKITATSGDRSASIQIVFISTKVIGVTQLTHSFNILESEEYVLSDNRDYSINPGGVTDSVNWSSSDHSVASVDKYSGKVIGLRQGSAIITGSVPGLSIDNTGVSTEIDYEISYTVNVGATQTVTGISFAGNATASKTTMSTAIFNFSYNAEKVSAYGDLKLEYDEDVFKDVSITYANGTGSLSATFRASVEEGKKYAIGICAADNSHITSIFVTKAVLSTASISLEKTVYKVSRTGLKFVFGISSDAENDAAFVVVYKSSNENVLSVITIANECYATPRSEGTATVTATVYKRNSNTVIKVTEPVTLSVVNPYSSISLDDNSKNFGLEREFVFGAHNLAGTQKTLSSYVLTLKGALTSAAQTAVIANEYNSKLVWSTSDESIATVENGIISPSGNSGIVTISVKSVYNETFNENVSASFKIRCLADGVNVKDYDDLMLCSQNGWPIVLQNNVMLAPKLADKNFEGYKSYLNDVCTFKMNTTADNSYYVDNNIAEESYVRYCVEFTADVYGNGHYINAHNITRSRDVFGYSVFTGPLDIVRLKKENSSEQNAAVKAQDNIVFLIKKDNVNLRNVELKGCNDSAVAGDLTNLNFCGTILEVVGDNASIEYSRINNGRTVVRIFGTPATNNASVASNPSAYRISTDIGNCILSFGREFILKVGSNQSLKNASASGMVGNSTPSNSPALYDDAAPYLTKENGENYPVTGEKDDYFYDNYVMTDLTLRNSVFHSAGLFCIGLESKFAGLCLHGYDYSDSYKFGSELGWGRVAGTSYPAVIRLQGDVRFYDWKKVADVNSDTLIEGDPKILNLVGLNLNVGNLLESYSGNNFDKLTVTSEGEKYVNGAIAFYGGGKNYSYVDTTGIGSSFNTLSHFTIPLEVLGSRVNLIYFSAGSEPFRFLLYDSSCALDINKQKADMADNTAYTWVTKK